MVVITSHSQSPWQYACQCEGHSGQGRSTGWPAANLLVYDWNMKQVQAPILAWQPDGILKGV